MIARVADGALGLVSAVDPAVGGNGEAEPAHLDVALAAGLATAIEIIAGAVGCREDAA